MDPDVTICIPAYQAEGFIAGTLACAQAQTHESVRILVSVDRSSDATVAICAQVAREDSRVEVIVQPHRLGWTGNANTLLDRVTSPYLLFYFHDDLIDPDYVEALLGAMDDQAASAHGDLRLFGLREEVVRGVEYADSPAVRIVRSLSQHRRGMLLRALTRRDAVAGLRFPDLPGDGTWRVTPYVLGLLAAGPSRYVTGDRYQRWIRPDGLTRSWRDTPLDEVVSGHRIGVAHCLELIDRLAAGDDEARTVMTYALYANVMATVRQRERRRRWRRRIPATSISPRFSFTDPPAALGSLPPDVRADLLALAP